MFGAPSSAPHLFSQIRVLVPQLLAQALDLAEEPCSSRSARFRMSALAKTSAIKRRRGSSAGAHLRSDRIGPNARRRAARPAKDRDDDRGLVTEAAETSRSRAASSEEIVEPGDRVASPRAARPGPRRSPSTRTPETRPAPETPTSEIRESGARLLRACCGRDQSLDDLPRPSSTSTSRSSGATFTNRAVRSAMSRSKRSWVSSLSGTACRRGRSSSRFPDSLPAVARASAVAGSFRGRIGPGHPAGALAHPVPDLKLSASNA